MISMKNIPVVKLGIVAVSRDCFPMSLSEKRRKAVVEACKLKGVGIYEVKAIVENEKDVMAALDDFRNSGVNSLVVYLGNFGPEGPETLLAQKFTGPVMFAAAAEEVTEGLIYGRGDAFCGMLNASYNLGLRNLNPYIPEYPVGTPDKIADMIADFENISRVILGISNLKIISFGPRPQDFLACNAPIKPLYDLGVEIMENSELDLFESFCNHAGDPRIPEVVKDMEQDINNTVPGDMYENNRDKFEGFRLDDLFIGFHCGNTPKACMKSCSMKYQLIMHSLLEPGKEPDITRGTLEGTVKPGGITLFRLQSTADCRLKCYAAEGRVIDVDPSSFGSIGVFAIKEMARFYRHVLIAGRFPHHTGVGFMNAGKVLFAAMRMVGIEDIAFNQPAGMLYKNENPFK